MRRIAPSADLRANWGRRGQSGQAIVLIALMLIALFGFLGLAVDGGRVYVERRELQDAVDAAALAAGDNYERTAVFGQAVAAGENAFALNVRIGPTGYSSTAALSSPSGTSYTWPDGTNVQLTYQDTGVKGQRFYIVGSQNLALAFMRMFGIGPNVTIGAAATALVGNQRQTPALLTLGRNGCNGVTGDSLKISGSANVAVIGDVYSNGDISDTANSNTVNVNGDVFAGCTPISSLVNYTGTGQSPVRPLPDPGYVSTYQPNYDATGSVIGSSLRLTPGIYNQNTPQFPASSGCYWLDPGIYTWTQGFKATGGFLSNFLRPPDEPLDTDNTQPAAHQVWNSNGTRCAGSFGVAAVPASSGHPLTPGGQAWGVVVTSVRSDSWTLGPQPGTYIRESSPSMCRTFNPNGSSQGFQVALSNVPGAQSYNVYLSSSGCAAPFGYVGSVNNNYYSSETNNTSGCPSLPSLPASPGSGSSSCSLGKVVSQVFDTTNVALPWTPLATQCTTPNTNDNWLPAQGCQPPDGLGALYGGAGTGAPESSPARNLPPRGDRANENDCKLPSSDLALPCSGAQVTPGAAQFYFPPNACIDLAGSGGLMMFSGYQFDWIGLYAPGNPTPNTCTSNSLHGSSNTMIIGSVYMPTGSIEIAGGSNAPLAGQVVVNTAVIDGSGGVAIAYNPDILPAPPAARLIQ